MKKKMLFLMFGALIAGTVFLHFKITENRYDEPKVARQPEESVRTKEAETSVPAGPRVSPSAESRPDEKLPDNEAIPPGQHALTVPVDSKVPADGREDDTTHQDMPIETNGFVPERPALVFSDTVANKHTIRVFKELQYRFDTGSDLEAHMAEVRRYLAGELDENQLNEVMDLYGKFTEYEISLVSKVPEWGNATLADQAGALELLETIRRDRADFFGQETADALFGEEYRWQRYQVLKQDIIKDPRAFGPEKEERLEALKSEIWGTSVNVEEMKSPLERYEELTILYKNDLERMTEKEKEETLRRFRHQSLPPEAARLLDRGGESQTSDLN